MKPRICENCEKETEIGFKEIARKRRGSAPSVREKMLK